jgi:subtilisin family serine protease
VVSYGVNIKGAIPGGDTKVSSGTSFSTPLVAGVVADLAQRYGKDYTADQYYQSIIKGATDLGPIGWDTSYGNGMVNGTDAFNVMSEMTPRSTFFEGGLGLILIGSVISVSPFIKRKYD